MRTSFLMIVMVYVAVVNAGVMTGSGCAVTEKELVTCFHVVDGATNLEIRTAQGISLPARLTKHSKELDWAILSVESSTFSPVSIADDSQLRLGDKVYVLGFPSSSILGRSLKYADGSISDTTDNKMLQMSVPIQPGNSGGPLFNEYGQLVGIVTSTIDPLNFYRATGGAMPQNINFALRINTVIAPQKKAVKKTIKDNQASTFQVVAYTKDKFQQKSKDEPYQKSHIQRGVHPKKSMEDRYKAYSQGFKHKNQELYNYSVTNFNINASVESLNAEFEAKRTSLESNYRSYNDEMDKMCRAKYEIPVLYELKSWSKLWEERKSIFRKKMLELAAAYFKAIQTLNNTAAKKFFDISLNDVYDHSRERYFLVETNAVLNLFGIKMGINVVTNYNRVTYSEKKPFCSCLYGEQKNLKFELRDSVLEKGPVAYTSQGVRDWYEALKNSPSFLCAKRKTVSLSKPFCGAHGAMLVVSPDKDIVKEIDLLIPVERGDAKEVEEKIAEIFKRKLGIVMFRFGVYSFNFGAWSYRSNLDHTYRPVEYASECLEGVSRYTYARYVNGLTDYVYQDTDIYCSVATVQVDSEYYIAISIGMVNWYEELMDAAIKKEKQRRKKLRTPNASELDGL